MGRSPTTHRSLLIRLGDPEDRDAWDRFVHIYGPLIYAYGRHRGLQDADASDLVQEVLGAVATAVDRFAYDPARGSFRGWLLTITRNEWIGLIQRRDRQGAGVGGTTHQAVLNLQTIGNDDEAFWEREHRQIIYNWAADQVRHAFRPATWSAFERTAVEGQAVEAVALQLGMSVGAVYIAKSRILARLREVVATVESEPIPNVAAYQHARP